MRRVKFFYFTTVLTFSLLACANELSLPFMATATPSPVPLISFEVTVIGPTPTDTATPPATSTPAVLTSVKSTPTLTVSDVTTQAQVLPLTTTLTVTPNSTALLTPTLVTTTTSPLTATAQITQTTEVTTSAETSTAQESPAPSGSITLVYPENEAVIASSTHELEFKWDWHGDLTLGRCDTVPDYGFELRIWPALDGFGPLGAMDAAKNAEDSFLGCDPETGLRSYLLTYLQNKPGVKAVGAGKFLWDVALVRLSPYEVVVTTNPRIFKISFDYYGSLDPFGMPLSCTDFNSWAEAQSVFLTAGGPAKDPHGLDPDSDGQICGELLEK